MESIHILAMDLAKRAFAICGTELSGFDKQSKTRKGNYDKYQRTASLGQ